MVTREKHDILWKGVDYFMRNSIKKGFGATIGVYLGLCVGSVIAGMVNKCIRKGETSEVNEEPNEGFNNESTEVKEEA